MMPCRRARAWTSICCGPRNDRQIRHDLGAEGLIAGGKVACEIAHDGLGLGLRPA